ncbi:MAG: glycosyltransferase family 4 protein [Bacteroidales bacterium]|nr:glycosyltransferase family 4 protein [Bacteroidales bacterium]
MLIVHIPSWFPIPEKPLNGNFISRHIESLGDRVQSVILHHVHPDFTPVLPQNATLFPVEISSANKLKLFNAYSSAFGQLIKTYGRPDILHLHVALPMGPVAVRLSRQFRIPLVVSEHWTGYLPMNRTKLSLTERLMLRHTFRHASHITAVSQNLLDNIAATVPVAAKKPQTVVGNVVDTAVFSLKPILPTRSKKQILHVSTLENDAKNIMGILHAVDALKKRREDFELNIVHDFRNILAETFVRERGLGSIVHFLGRKSSGEIAELLQQSDFFLLFSNYENQPCVLLESFCTGTPAITTPVGGILEITNENNAIIVAPKDESQLVEKLDYMLDNSMQYNTGNIRKQAEEICSPDVIGNKWTGIYRNVVETQNYASLP